LSRRSSPISCSMQVVYRHRKTLKSLHLWQIYLQGGCWWTWADSVQPWISSSLEQIEFTPSWYEQRYRGDSRRPWIESEDSLKRIAIDRRCRDKAGGWTRQIILEDYEYSLVGSTLRFGEFEAHGSLRSLEFPTRKGRSATFKALLSLNWRLIRRSILLNLDS
jgi:hypothetical protein